MFDGFDFVPNRSAFARRWLDNIENWLDGERDRLPLLVPVGLGAGVAIWQMAGDRIFWSLLLAFCASNVFALAIGRERYLGRLLIMAAVLILTGYAAIALKSNAFESVPLNRIWIGEIYGQIESVEDVSARGIVRLVLKTNGNVGLPRRVRVNVPVEKYQAEFQSGAIIRTKVRLMPPPGPSLPGGYDFARHAWFQGLGATGSVLGEVQLYSATKGSLSIWQKWRSRISDHIHRQMPAGSGPIGAALLVGTRGAISEDDAEALRNSGMAHLLSVSGLHVTAIVGGTFFLMARVLSLYAWFALRFRVPVVAAGVSAIVALGYTLLTGAEVPTIRACITALLILAALASGREALSLRLLAAGACVILLIWPESLAGPSFQLSFSAVATIIIVHESPLIRRMIERRDESIWMRGSRFVFSLLLTGLAIELVLAPIALFHFHKSGIYGAIANIIAIPLTTFFIMPLQMLGLLADGAGIGQPFWWAAGQGVLAIRWLAHFVSDAPGAVFARPAMALWAFTAIVTGALWIAIFQRKQRWLGAIPVGVGLAAMVTAPRPDFLLTGDGKHLALVTRSGQMALLRPNAGDYAISTLTENAAAIGEAVSIEDWPVAECSPDICSIALKTGDKFISILATRSGYLVPSMEMAAACKRADIVISDRRLPYSCKPRWLKADRTFLEQSGGIAFYLDGMRVETVATQTAHQPWSQLNSQPQKPMNTARQ
jgi:competence protein ComEC